LVIYKLSGKKDNDPPVFIEVPLSSLGEAGWSEKDLENYLAANITQVLREEHLMTVAQETSRQEEPDVLALDQEGRLYIFELKRWEGKPENLLQVLRYGQLLGPEPYGVLERRFHRGHPERPQLAEAHADYFSLDSPLAAERFNQKPQFVVVTAGSDMATLDAIEYWKAQGLLISSLTFHIYRDGGAHYVEWHAFSPTPDEYAGVTSKFFVVNTNATYDPEAYQEMLGDGRTGRAAAYGSRKSAVDGIAKGSTVFLYHTGVGIIARGKATESHRVCDFHGEPEAEHYVPLQFDPPVNRAEPFLHAVPAYAVNERLQMSHRFRQTTFRITTDMAKAMEELLRGRSANQS
jgi:hypothetical protein